ncbi:MAG: serine/threonine protein kinase, partial [Planctomycetales bacterium]|nr:serine/threonine protein kinase [Planctomycetales bacterium]
MTARTIFLNASEIESFEEREAYVREQCKGDGRLMRQVEALLRANDDPDSILDRPAIDLEGLATLAHERSGFIDDASIEEAGSTIGNYKLLQEIGQGGFGVVYMAEQEHPVRRQVALKIIKPGMDTREVIARFEAERQALALMDHPNIAKVFDAGATSSGRPYFVMELVKGVPITDFCDKNKFTTRKRLELFVAICNAVQHAHQKGVIHRDLKPSNVMITLHDGKPVPKVIDFGISKAISQRLTEKTLFTRYGQMIGTP